MRAKGARPRWIVACTRSTEQISEIVVKTATDYWVVAKRSEQRDFYVVLFKKDATILDINGAGRAHCACVHRSSLGALTAASAPATPRAAPHMRAFRPLQRRFGGCRKRSSAVFSWFEGDPSPNVRVVEGGGVGGGSTQ